MAIKFKTYAGLALDPIHVGTGEFQLGRVDNLIVREPGSRIPKIPGSSILGVTRAYAAMRETWPDGAKSSRYLYLDPSDGKTKSCAGKGGDKGEDHCGKPCCPVCVAFGFSKGNDKSSFQGLATFTDARILLFPVASGMETWWVTSPQVLLDADEVDDAKRKELAAALNINHEYQALTNKDGKGRIRLGWLSLDRATGVEVPKIKLPVDLKAQGAADHIAVIADDLFSAVVNDNLEVRTSVSISPSTGTAEPGALFTAEAIPRTTVFWFKAGIQQTEYFRIKDESGKSLPIKPDMDLDCKIEKALKDMENMGVGGLNTRGFGRLRVECWKGECK